MTQDGVPKDDVKVPEGDIGKDIQAGFDNGKDLLVTIISAMGEESVSNLFPYFVALFTFLLMLVTTDPAYYRPFPSRKRQKALR